MGSTVWNYSTKSGGVGAEVAWPMVVVQRGQHGVGAGLPVVGWFSVGAFLPVAEAAETKASGNSVRWTQNSWAKEAWRNPHGRDVVRL